MELSKDLALILMSAVVITPLSIGHWYIWRKAIQDVKCVESSKQLHVEE